MTERKDEGYQIHLLTWTMYSQLTYSISFIFRKIPKSQYFRSPCLRLTFKMAYILSLALLNCYIGYNIYARTYIRLHVHKLIWFWHFKMVSHFPHTTVVISHICFYNVSTKTDVFSLEATYFPKQYLLLSNH